VNTEVKHTVSELYAVASKLVEKELVKLNKKKLSPSEKLRAELIGKTLSKFALDELNKKQ
jgi:hypothetical protein